MNVDASETADANVVVSVKENVLWPNVPVDEAKRVNSKDSSSLLWNMGSSSHRKIVHNWFTNCAVHCRLKPCRLPRSFARISDKVQGRKFFAFPVSS